MEQVFVEFSLLIILATGAAFFLRALGQPLVLAYLLAGVAAGPLWLNLVSSRGLVNALSSFGIALLLFLVGLELNFERLRHLASRAVVLGLAQVAITTLAAVTLLHFFKVDGLGAWYLGLALAFSSTVIVVKVLADKQELDSLPGRITVGTLLVQDALAMLALIILPGLGMAVVTLQGLAVAVGIAKGVLLATAALLTGRYILPRLFSACARSSELLALASIAWCMLVVVVAAWLGLSLAMGAFVAGLALAGLPFNLAIAARLSTLRDFFIVLFFIGLGSQLSFSGFGELQPLLWTLIALVLIGNPLIAFMIMCWRGYRARTSLVVALALGMVSEFSLVLVQLGAQLNQIKPLQAQLITAVAAVTITITTYLLVHVESVYRKLAPILKRFERSTLSGEVPTAPVELSGHVVLFGYHRLGERLAHTLSTLGRQVLVIDFNPEVISTLKKRGVPCLYGDMGDMELLEYAQLERASMIISTVPDINDNLRLLKDLRGRGSQIPIYVTATSWPDCEALYQAGADYVIFPHYLSGEHFSLMLRELAVNPDRVRVDRTKHLAELAQHYANRSRH